MLYAASVGRVHQVNWKNGSVIGCGTMFRENIDKGDRVGILDETLDESFMGWPGR